MAAHTRASIGNHGSTCVVCVCVGMYEKWKHFRKHYLPLPREMHLDIFHALPFLFFSLLSLSLP